MNAQSITNRVAQKFAPAIAASVSPASGLDGLVARARVYQDALSLQPARLKTPDEVQAHVSGLLGQVANLVPDIAASAENLRLHNTVLDEARTAYKSSSGMRQLEQEMAGTARELGMARSALSAEKRRLANTVHPGKRLEALYRRESAESASDARSSAWNAQMYAGYASSANSNGNSASAFFNGMAAAGEVLDVIQESKEAKSFADLAAYHKQRSASPEVLARRKKRVQVAKQRVRDLEATLQGPGATLRAKLQEMNNELGVRKQNVFRSREVDQQLKAALDESAAGITGARKLVPPGKSLLWVLKTSPFDLLEYLADARRELKRLTDGAS